MMMNRFVRALRSRSLIVALGSVMTAGSALAQISIGGGNLFGPLGGGGGNQRMPALSLGSPANSNDGSNDLIKLLSDSVSNIDEAKEIEIGRQLSAVLLGSKPLHPNVALQRYVNQLGRWLSLQTSRPNLPWTFAVIDDPGFNAFAAPGGFVFVTKGLIDRVDESELAGILAHEITHVIQKHHLVALASKARAGVATQLVASQLRNNAAGLIGGQMLALGRNLYSSGLDQGDEYEADLRAVTLAASAGFDPFGLPAVLQQLRTASPDNPLFSLSLSTHPPAQQRLEQLERAMGHQMDKYSGKPSVTVAQRVGKGAR